MLGLVTSFLKFWVPSKANGAGGIGGFCAAAILAALVWSGKFEGATAEFCRLYGEIFAGEKGCGEELFVITLMVIGTNVGNYLTTHTGEKIGKWMKAKNQQLESLRDQLPRAEADYPKQKD